MAERHWYDTERQRNEGRGGSGDGQPGQSGRSGGAPGLEQSGQVFREEVIELACRA